MLQSVKPSLKFTRKIAIFSITKQKFAKMSSCIFCKIISGEQPSQKLYEDDEIFIFKDIRPAAKFHFLAVPKKHLPNANSLQNETDKQLVEKLVGCGKQVLESEGGDLGDVRLGFHLPPFNTVSHLHLHVISPASSMSFFHRLAFRANSWWFASDQQILEKIANNSKL